MGKGHRSEAVQILFPMLSSWYIHFKGSVAGDEKDPGEPLSVRADNKVALHRVRDASGAVG